MKSLADLPTPPGHTIEGIAALGGMGTILRAREHSTGRLVALKVLNPSSSPEAHQRFTAEARLTASLEHPNIVPVHTIGSTPDEAPFYTMKFVRGKTLRALLESAARGDSATAAETRLPVLLTIFQKVCDAVSFAHGKEILHRDLKPDNIMLGDFGEVLVMDWGIAKALGTPAQSFSPAINPQDFFSTLQGQVLGSPHYMAPEQARGENQSLDARSDIHALGAILHHMLVLEPRLSGSNATEVLSKVATPSRSGPPPFDAFGKRIPESLRAIIRKATAFQAADRYRTVADLQADLTAYQSGFATQAENAPLHRQISLLALRHKTFTAALLLILVLATGFSLQILREKNTAVRERQRAEDALSTLVGTAPAFLALSRSLLEEARLPEALEKASAAVDLDPSSPSALLQRALLRQSSGDLPNAAADFQEILSSHPQDFEAAKHLAVTRQLLAEPDKTKRQSQLLATLRGQNRNIEAAPLAEKIDPDSSLREATLRARLKQFTAQPDWSENRIVLEPDGTFAVDLTHLAVGSLAPLAGQPVSRLHLDHTDASDLTPLSDLPLRHLTLKQSRVADLSPLAGLPVEHLDLSSTPVRDVSPLAGMPLRHLVLDNLPLAEIPDVSGMPLHHLSIRNTIISNLERLRGLPLQSLIASAPHIKDLSPLADLHLESLDLSQSRAGDLTPLAKMQTLRRLTLSGTRVYDLAPLAHIPLRHLDISNTNTTDLSPLATTPLETLRCDKTRATDLTPLAKIPTLRELVLPPLAENLEPLRSLPLDRLSKKSLANRPTQTAQEFWQTHDTTHTSP